MMIATAFAAPADFPRCQAARALDGAGVGRLRHGQRHRPVLAARQPRRWVGAPPFHIADRRRSGAVPAGALLPRIKPVHTGERRIDWLGALLLVVAVGAPLAALELGFASGDHAHPGLALGLAVAGIAAIALLVRSNGAWHPDLPAARAGEPRTATAESGVNDRGRGNVRADLLQPLLLQQVLGYTPSQAGLLLTPLVAAISVGSIINGRLFHRQTEPQRLMVFGACLLAAGTLMVLLISPGTSALWILSAFFVNGCALGFLLPNLTLFMQMLSERRDVGVASALVQTTRAIGSALGTALVGILISHSSVLNGVRTGLGLCIVLS